jgi:hypothetical protein
MTEICLERSWSDSRYEVVRLQGIWPTKFTERGEGTDLVPSRQKLWKCKFGMRVAGYVLLLGNAWEAPSQDGLLCKVRINNQQDISSIQNFILSRNSTCFGHLLCPSSWVISCTRGNWYVSCRLCGRILLVIYTKIIMTHGRLNIKCYVKVCIGLERLKKPTKIRIVVDTNNFPKEIGCAFALVKHSLWLE